MKTTIRAARPEELQNVLHLLESLDLPPDGVQEHLGGFLVAEGRGRLLGTVGLEIYDSVGLLRSLAVDREEQGSGLGTRLVESVLKNAREKNLEAVYLLTTTAKRYFPRFGFERLTREEVDARLNASKELQGACPQTAVCMRLIL